MPSSPASAERLPWCVVGAGPSGLAALKRLREVGIPAECLEREGGIGGNWRFGSGTSRVFASTRLISSKSLTAIGDFPMPREFPPYPDHRQCLEYLEAYARTFELVPHVCLGTAVERVEPLGDPGTGWEVHVAAAPPRRYAGVVIASGHNHVPRWPGIPGTFTGTIMHAADYKSPLLPVPLAGRRVLVIGGGNSGCDIAVESARHAAATTLSTRRGYFVVPRMVFGRPADLRAERLLRMNAPVWLRRLAGLRLIDRTVGLPWRHGLPRPDHRLFETHPVINSDLLGLVDAGRIRPAGDVAAFAGREVVFRDGRREAFDVVICATGYQIAHPFIDARLLGSSSASGIPDLFLHLLTRDRNDLAVVGLIQPDSGQWGITDLQAAVVARMALAVRTAPRAAAWLYRIRRRPEPRPPITYIDSPRHALEVEHFSYQRQLRHVIAGLDRRLRRHGGEVPPEHSRRPAGSPALPPAIG